MIDIDKLSESVPRGETYLGEDGFLHCAVCGEAVETIINVPLRGERKVRCICSCRENERNAEAEREKQEQRERNRRICFNGSKLKEWTFENSLENENLKIGRNYVEDFQNLKRKGKGILLFGSTSKGKSFLAACIANALLDQGEMVRMRNFATITNELFAVPFDGKQEYINSLCRCDLLIIDDLGAERDSEYMYENIFNVVETRKNMGLPLIVTTNLTAEQLKKPVGMWEKRIYERLIEMCHPVEIEGENMRRKKLKDDFQEMQQLLMKEI